MRKTSKNFSLKEEYKKSLGFIKSCNFFILLIAIIFFISSLLGFFITPPIEIERQILEIIRQLLEKTQGMSALELINFIFLNNLKASFIGLVSGIILGIFPILVAIGNGYLLGFVASKSVDISGILSLWKVFPHGIFELPAVLISLGMGIKIGSFIFKKNKLNFLKTSFLKSLEVFLIVIIPLLVVAAIIEGLLVYFA